MIDMLLRNMSLFTISHYDQQYYNENRWFMLA